MKNNLQSPEERNLQSPDGLPEPTPPHSPTSSHSDMTAGGRTDIPTHTQTILKNFRQELLVIGYSERTIKMYLIYAQKLLKHSGKDPANLTKQDVIGFLALAREQNVSNATLSLMHSAVRFFLEKHLKMNIVEEIKIPKKAKKLPVVLTMSEIRSIFQNTKHGRNRLLLQFIYSTGCRVSEAVNMKLVDLDWENGIANVRGGKGNKDRVVVLSQKWTGEMKKYLNRRKVKSESLFAKKNGKNISTDTVERVIRKAAQESKILKRVTPHVLRHSFATHLLESGENIRKIQVLLGHANLSTTSIYTHVSREEIKKVQSPFDKL
jgi:integrase/recombinase XerD